MGAGNASGRFLGPLIILSAMAASIPYRHRLPGGRAAVLPLAEADHRRRDPWRDAAWVNLPGGD